MTNKNIFEQTHDIVTLQEMEEAYKLPLHIVRSIAKDAKNVLASDKFNDTRKAVLYSLQIADLAGLDDNEQLQRAADWVISNSALE